VNDILLAVLTFFVFLVAVAMCIQAAMLVGIWKTTKQLQEQATSVLPQVRSVLSKAELTLEENRKNIADVTTKAGEIAAKINALTETAHQIAGKANEMMDIGKVQMQRLDVVVADASERARVQLERAELVVDDTMSRVHESVTAVHNGILKPIREIHGLTAGFRAALQALLRGGRPSVADATHDDEMFIG
jgi:flagellar biosynthesis protein FliQ